jgi:hypothetical protein
MCCHTSHGMQVSRYRVQFPSLMPSQSTKVQIEEIYRLRHRERLAQAIRDGNFSLLDENQNIILPTLWEQVVSSPATLQVSLPPDILDPDITSPYPHVEGAPYVEDVAPRYRRHSLSVLLPDDDAADHEVLDVLESASASVDHGSGTEDESDLDSTGSESERSERAVRGDIPDEPPRQVTVPTDEDGNSLVFQIKAAPLRPTHQVTANTDANDQVNKRDSQRLAGNPEHMNIIKAVTAQSDGRMSLQICVLPGPRTSLTHPDIDIRWFHLHSERLDFARFRDTCLGISGLSERLRNLVKQLLDKIEKETLKVFLGGMFIEPGTVLRADESRQVDSKSVIFSCIPYFSLHAPIKQTPAATNRFSSRTLMQSYYPYEPVQERDAEQAYRVFGNERHNALVHVPNMWMLNIGSSIVATCGHEALSKHLVQSMEVVEENRLREKGVQDGDAPTITIRLRDWDHRKLLYTLQECRSFFQMEQRLRELRWCSTRPGSKKSLQLSWHTTAGTAQVTPGTWPGIAKQRDAVFIDLSLPSGGIDDSKLDSHLQIPSSTLSLSIPFFCWPQTLDTDKAKTDVSVPDDTKRLAQCLESVEKAMLSAVLSSYGLCSAVEEAFTTTAYYRSLAEETTEHVETGLQAIHLIHERLRSATSSFGTVHETLVHRQQAVIAKYTLELYDTMQETLVLFVGHVDKSTMLQKLWGAMNSIANIAKVICEKSPVNHHDSAVNDKDRSANWCIRPDIDDPSFLASSPKIKRTFERCRKCRSNTMYGSSKAALSHLNKHLRCSDHATVDHVRPEQWLASYSEKELEMSMEGMGKILTVACQTAQQLFDQAKELSDGVRNEDGQMSTLYTFPRPLLSAFRQLLVFYFAIERSLSFTNKALDNKKLINETPVYIASLPFSPEGLQVIEAFGNGVQQALLSAREELCSMVKSKEPLEVFKRLSLSPEYVCGWLTRRLLVKPLEKSMTVSDMYREYLSTIVSYQILLFTIAVLTDQSNSKSTIAQASGYCAPSISFKKRSQLSKKSTRSKAS